ncbi:hypothetical protein KKC_06677 [Listeria fleischmannii subsp. coloradonensis]|nr:hypothetical protein KKC_06677 [Listeria fleischmannii subsp. coloradonensis]
MLNQMSYSRKGGEDSSHSIIYEKDGKLFVSYKKKKKVGGGGPRGPPGGRAGKQGVNWSCDLLRQNQGIIGKLNE